VSVSPGVNPANGRVAVVTGAASGIGLGVAQRFAAGGLRVALLDRHGEAAEAAAAALRSEGAVASAHQVDVADRPSVAAAFDRVRASLGPVAVLVTSAGVDAFDPALDITAETWDRVMAVNLTGTFVCIQAALPDMIAAGWGRVVTISSSSAQSGPSRMAHYAASKAGVIGLTKSLAREFARNGITVNCIPPSLVDTPMARAAEARGMVDVDVAATRVPVGRAGTAADVAAACAFLCSDEASYITGQLIGVNGGNYI
jgi:NAD(P)-dependent dehydrogenase (short-subunit alcohol dehydrogenase family)